MTETDEFTHLIADVREQLVYYKELGVELLDVNLESALAAEEMGSSASKLESPSPAVAARVPSEPREMPNAPPSIDIAKPNTKRPSKLSALPSLANRPMANGSFENGKLAAKQKETHDMDSANQIGEKAGKTGPEQTGKSFAEALFDVGPELPKSGETIEDIRADIGDCTRCPLYTGRTQIVHSTGNRKADLMFVGEAPGAEEDAQGFPFVGRAGQLLTKIIESISYKREDVFIGNINRCRPPGNRQPTLPEAHTCRPFLLREIAVVRPKVIVVLGNTAMHNLLDTKVGITKMRGQFQDYFGVKVMPTFHPAFLLRDPNKKREVWEDMKKVRDHLRSAK